MAIISSSSALPQRLLTAEGSRPAPLSEGQALELSLTAPLDAFQGLGVGFGSIPKRVVVEGEITRADDPAYKKTIHVTRELDASTGTYVNTSSVKGHDGEVSVSDRTAWDMRDGFSSSGSVTQGGAAGEVHTRQSFLPLEEGGGLRIEGRMGDVLFATDQRMEFPPPPSVNGQESSVSHQDGYIGGPDEQGVRFSRQLTSDFHSGHTTIAGKFGSLDETGFITFKSPDAPHGPSVEVERQVGPYKIRQFITVENQPFPTPA